MIALLAASLFFCEPVLLDLPRAEAYLDEDESGAMRLVDRYNAFDLWTARRSYGCWRDDEGREFSLYVLDAALPALLSEAPVSRVEFEREVAPLAKDDMKNLALDVQALVPVPIAPFKDWVKPHQVPRTCREVRYCEGTNEDFIVAVYLPEKSARWQLAVWALGPEDDREEFRETFEERFLAKRAWTDRVPPEPTSRSSRTKRKAEPTERALLRRDLAQSVTNYPRWRVTDSPGYVVLDELGGTHADFVARLTNELVAVRAKYAKSVPSPIDGSNTLAIARIYAERKSYLLAAGPEMSWSAAYWCQPRREIVAHLPADGEERLLKTLRHEGFHQYLAYAGSMILAAPWINEGYAEYFESDEDETERRLMALQELAVAQPKMLSASLVRLLSLDYDDFYSEDRVQCALNYRLAWSVAYFLEKGAPEVRFRPFANLTRDYMKALLKTRDRARATEAVFTTEKLDLFVAEWLKFYKAQ